MKHEPTHDAGYIVPRWVKRFGPRPPSPPSTQRPGDRDAQRPERNDVQVPPSRVTH